MAEAGMHDVRIGAGCSSLKHLRGYGVLMVVIEAVLAVGVLTFKVLTSTKAGSDSTVTPHAPHAYQVTHEVRAIQAFMQHNVIYMPVRGFEWDHHSSNTLGFYHTVVSNLHLDSTSPVEGTEEGKVVNAMDGSAGINYKMGRCSALPFIIIHERRRHGMGTRRACKSGTHKQQPRGMANIQGRLAHLDLYLIKSHCEGMSLAFAAAAMVRDVAVASLAVLALIRLLSLAIRLGATGRAWLGEPLAGLTLTSELAG